MFAKSYSACCSTISTLKQKNWNCIPQRSPSWGIIVEGEVRMGLEIVKAVQVWPTPLSRKQVQWFLGFANFYRKFIRNFSCTAAPLHQLTSGKHKFSSSPLAEAAFTSLKDCFTSTPILTIPDPKSQFIVQVDASDVLVGPVLSQRRSADGKLHPCAVLSQKLSAAESNYDIGDREPVPTPRSCVYFINCYSLFSCVFSSSLMPCLCFRCLHLPVCVCFPAPVIACPALMFYTCV